MDAVASSMVSELGTMVDTLSETLADVAPLAVPIIGIGLVVVLGVKLFKRIANKA